VAKAILIVDDDPKSLKLTRDLLSVVGYTIIEATDGKKAVELARSRKPDLILMDIHMPIMDGFAAIRMIKAETTTRNIPVIAITASIMKSDIEKVVQAGYNGYIAKPIDIKELLKKVEEYLSASAR